MRNIAIVTREIATVEELCAAYALAEYLTYHNTRKGPRGEAIPTTSAYVVRSNEDEMDQVSRKIQKRYSHLTEQNTKKINQTPDVKIAIGVRRFKDMGKRQQELWSEWMDAEKYIIHSGKRVPKESMKGFSLHKRSVTRFSCTELVYDYIVGNGVMGLCNVDIADLLYLGLRWYTKAFTENISDDTFQIAQTLVRNGKLHEGGLNNELPNFERLLCNPLHLDPKAYGRMLSESSANDLAVLCEGFMSDVEPRWISDVESGLLMLDRITKDFGKDVSILYGNIEDPESGKDQVIVYLHVDNQWDVERELRLDAKRILDKVFGQGYSTGISGFATGLFHGNIIDGQTAYILLNNDLKQDDGEAVSAEEFLQRVKDQLEKQIMEPLETSVDMLKASLGKISIGKIQFC